MYFQKTYTPRPGDYNRHGKLSFEAILQILESAANDHSSDVHDSIVSDSKNSITWILTEWRVKIIRRPQNGESLDITTWVRGKANANIVYRDFFLTDENDDEVIRAEAKFALFDLDTSKLARISEELLNSYRPEEKTIFEEVKRLRAPSEYDTEKTLSLRRSDIDFNGHVHNTRYVDLAMETLPQEVFEKDNFCELRIVYSKPLKENDSVCGKCAATDNSHIAAIYNQNGLCTLLELK